MQGTTSQRWRQGGGEYGVTGLARRQLADKLKIPFAYFERMRAGQPVLLDRNVNTWLQTRRRPPDDPHAGRPGEGGAV
jgi:hypothetical protein